MSLRAWPCLAIVVFSACDGGRRVPQVNEGQHRDAATATRDAEAEGTEAGLPDAESLDAPGAESGVSSDAAQADAGSLDAGPGDAALRRDGSELAPDATADPCAGVSCSGHGRCAVSGGQTLCLCDPSYVPDGLSCVIPPPTPPSVTSLLASPMELAPAASLIITAEVADPDGAGDIQSGVLEDLSGHTLGVFAAVRPGSWRWSGAPADLLASTTVQIDEVGPLVLVARFYDRAGGQGSAQVSVTLRCPSGQGICGTTACASLTSGAHCGSCARSCAPLGPDYSCAFPDCWATPIPERGRQSCDDACGLGTCQYADFYGILLPLHQPCSAVAPATEEYDLRITRVACDCYTQISSVPPAGVSCQQYCTGPLGCRYTQLTVQDIAGGGITYLYDACEPPYRNAPDLTVGNVLHHDFGPPRPTCGCRGAPR